MSLEPTDLVDDVMSRWPSTIRVFLRYRMGCVGCPIGCFHTVADACREHAVDCGAFLADLRTAVEAARGGEG
jgi:hybrid cluster-associated redox disulfide protein